MMNNPPSRPLFPWLMLFSRSGLFLAAQLLITLVLTFSETANAWQESARWWPFFALFANIFSVFFLAKLTSVEGGRYLDLLRFSRKTWKKDLLWLLGTSVIGLPLAMAPMGNLATLLFGDSMVPIHMMFRPLPTWAFVVSFLFPLTIPFAELPTYFGYVMPRLAAQLKNGWAAWLISALVLGAQHCFLPLILEPRFILWRLGMYLPFALFAGLVLKLRPTLMPYMIIIHGLMDISALAVYWMI